MAADTHFDTLNKTHFSQADAQLALRHAPLIQFDVKEPFFPSVAGYTIFRQNGPSPSFPREILLPPGAVTGIEYAIWWDWDMQHLYELEHIWVYLDADEKVVAAEASWHGGYNSMTLSDGSPPLKDNRVILYSEPGKHAFAPVKDWMLERAPTTQKGCTTQAGVMGVHVTPLFEGIIQTRTVVNNRLVHTYLTTKTFEPTFDFSNVFDLSTVTHVPWDNLFQWIPGRVAWWTQELERTVPPAQKRFLRIAHRGASAYAQEGSQSSIQKAAELGADMVEIDIRFTADHIPVVAHDSNLRRVFGVDGDISQLSLAELSQLTPPDREPIMTFTQMVETCAKLNLGLYLDIKELNPQAFQAMVNDLQTHHMLKYTIFGSFRPDFLAEIKAHIPQATTSILFSSTHVDPVVLAQSVMADCVHPCWERFDQPDELLTPEWISEVRKAGLAIICWHEERPEVIAGLQARGVDGICSDMPELLVL